MTTLHTLNKSSDREAMASCLGLLRKGDSLLLLEDGVYHCCAPDWLADLPRKCTVYGLREDLLARGLMDRVADDIKVISTRKFVQLCCDHSKVINWF